MRWIALLTLPLLASAQTLTLQAAAGDFVVGSATVPAPVTLTLRGPQGQVLRRYELAAGEAEFRFVTAQAGAHTLSLAGSADSARRLQLLEHKPRSEQVADQPPRDAAPDSPLLKLLLAEHGAGPAFWVAVARVGTPVVEDIPNRPEARRVSFLWRGAQTASVRLFWPVRQGDQERFARVPGSDIWHYSVVLPATTRLSYQLAPDVPQLRDAARQTQRRAILATAQVDPLNPRRWTPVGDDLHAAQSMLELPAAPAEPWLTARTGTPKGSLQTLRFTSRRMGNVRDMTVYLPAGHDGRQELPLLLLFDQDAYLGRVPTPTLLDNLIAAGRIPPLMAVLVANPTRDSRSVELPCNVDFADAMAQELLPWLKQRHAFVTNDPARTVVAGSSFGGLASTWLALRHPQRFGNVLSLSGSYWWAPARPPGQIQGDLADASEGEWLTHQLALAPADATRYFLSSGLLERSAPADGPGILETNRHLRDVLKARGNHLVYREFAGGHDYINWRSELAEGLIALLGKP